MSVLSTLFCCFNHSSNTAQAEPREKALSSGLFSICGEDYVVLPGDSRYAEWSKSYNLDKLAVARPAAVVRPKTTQEVADVVMFAVENGYKVQAKSGGHSYANFCLGGPGSTNTVVVDLVELKKFSVDKETWYATIGAGTLLGDVTMKLHDAGGRAFAHGVCPGVGLGGHATIGGIGPMSRMWGTSLDHVVEVEVVVADGRILRASETQNADLFFAIRGAGASFGIVTEFVMRTHPEPGNVVQYTYTFSFGEHDIAQVFKQWRDLAYDPDMDRRLGTLITITGHAAFVEAIFYGTDEEFQASGLPQRLPTPSDLTCDAKGWVGHLVHLGESEALHASNIRSAFYHKSLGFRQQDTLSDGAVDKMVHYILNAPEGFHEISLFIFSAQGGAINDVPVEATSYGHRDKVMFYENYIINTPNVSQENKDYFNGFHKLMLDALAEPKLISTTYAGYVDPDLGPGVKAGPAYWGELYPRLRKVKTTWDPRDVFHNLQSVRPVDDDN